MTQKITTCSIYNRANDELKYSLLGARRLKPIRAQKVMSKAFLLNVPCLEMNEIDNVINKVVFLI